MNKILKFMPKVKKIRLILVASIVWFIASLNVVNLGFKTLSYSIEIINLIIAVVVFFIFFKLIFSKMVKKHTIRILSYEDEKIEIYKFFDKKSYFIMIFMITFGITLRKLGVIPYQWLGSMYLGIGFALLGASIGFYLKYRLHLHTD